MRIRTPADLGALIRDRRTKMRLDQKTLAEKVSVSRQWIVDVEKGKPRTEIGLILRTLDVLGIPLTAGEIANTERQSGLPPVDIDSIVAAARRKRQ
jgi:y4mF family transcriptional regulator